MLVYNRWHLLMLNFPKKPPNQASYQDIVVQRRRPGRSQRCETSTPWARCQCERSRCENFCPKVQYCPKDLGPSNGRVWTCIARVGSSKYPVLRVQWSLGLSQKTNATPSLVSFVFQAINSGVRNCFLECKFCCIPKIQKWFVFDKSWRDHHHEIEKIKVPLFSRDSSMYLTNVPLWEIPISALYSGYLRVLIPKNP